MDLSITSRFQIYGFKPVPWTKQRTKKNGNVPERKQFSKINYTTNPPL
jgi:hypothetical protein